MAALLRLGTLGVVGGPLVVFYAATMWMYWHVRHTTFLGLSSFFKLTRPRSPMRAPLCTYMRSVSHHFLSHHYYILVPIMIIVYLARPIVGFGGAMRGYRI